MTADCPEHATEVSVVVLTLNEETNLPACLASVGWAQRVFVVDAGSTDRTKEIARSHGAIVVAHPFETHAVQWLWALQNLPIETDWILALDADQRITPELAAEIRALGTKADDADGFYIKRRQVFRNRWIKHGGYYPKFLLKMFRRDKVLIDPADLVDHHFYVRGRVGKLRHDLVEANKKEDDISFWVEKHSRYATLLAREELRWRRGTAGAVAITPSLMGNPDERTLALKIVWRRMPLYVRPFLYFVYRYVFRFGFLDGKQGAIFHFMQAFWFRLLVDIKLDEMQQQGSRS